MTDRRRNVLILVLVGALLAAAIAVVATKPTRLGLDLKGGVELVYQAKPTNGQQLGAESVTRAIDIMRQRVDALGVAEPEIQQSGRDQIVVSLPNVTNAEEAARVVGTTAQLQFYDWEKNVLGPDCKPALLSRPRMRLTTCRPRWLPLPLKPTCAAGRCRPPRSK